MNCINPISVDGKSDEKVVDIQVIPDLHVIEGTVNYLVTHMETYYTKMEEIYDKLNIAKTGQHGGKFNGNPCRKILKNWEIYSQCASSNEWICRVSETFEQYCSWMFWSTF